MLEGITHRYFASRPAGERAAVVEDINDFFNQEGLADMAGNLFADRMIKNIINTEFTDKGIKSDISNIQRRILLGEKMIEANAAIGGNAGGTN